MLKRYHEQGWQLDIHAIGDAAIEQVLLGMEAADSDAHPFAGRRHRIEHCGFVTRDQRRRMKARGILPVPQPVFMYEFGDLYVRNLGPGRSMHAYPMKTWLDDGAHPAASSDAPVSTVDPFINLFTMLTRQTNKGTVMGAGGTAHRRGSGALLHVGAAPTRNSPRTAAARWSPACRPTSRCFRPTSSRSNPMPF